MTRQVDFSANRILAGLTGDESQRLRPHLKVVSFKLGDVLFRPGDSTPYFYFPQNAVVSLVSTMQDGKAVEVSLVGSEGLVGIRAALGAKTHWFEAVAQVAGNCLKIKADVFRAELKGKGVLLDLLHHYSSYLLAQISQTAACNRVHRLDKRLARWILMTADLANKDEIPETHEFLSRMLGADRSEVTLAAERLRNSGAIAYSPGKIKILNRKVLGLATCECYQILREELDFPLKVLKKHRASNRTSRSH